MREKSHVVRNPKSSYNTKILKLQRCFVENYIVKEILIKIMPIKGRIDVSDNYLFT